MSEKWFQNGYHAIVTEEEHVESDTHQSFNYPLWNQILLSNKKSTKKYLKPTLTKYTNSKLDSKIRKLQAILDKSVGINADCLDKIDEVILKLEKKVKPI